MAWPTGVTVDHLAVATALTVTVVALWWCGRRHRRAAREIINLKNARAGLNKQIGEMEDQQRALKGDVERLTHVKGGLEERLVQCGAAIDQLRQSLDRLRPVTSELPSSYPMLEVVAVRRGQVLEDLTVTALSQACKMFFGIAAHAPAHEFVDRPAADLFKNLEGFIAPPRSHWHDLNADQERVLGEFLGLRDPVARYPILFNHRHLTYPGHSFVPVIVEKRWARDGDGTDRQYTMVLYLDTAKIPMYVLRHQLWESVKGELDRPALAAELRALADSLRERVREPGVRDELYAVEEALRDVDAGASFKLIECCARVGFFALKKEAEERGLTQLLHLVDRILNA